jgi:hypothetical protein
MLPVPLATGRLAIGAGPGGSSANPTDLGLVRLFSIRMDWRGLIRIERDFDLLGIETPSIPLNPYGLG